MSRNYLLKMINVLLPADETTYAGAAGPLDFPEHPI
jgi:hypothetical protein